MLKYYYCFGYILSLIFFVSTTSGLPAGQTDKLPALISDRIQMPSGTVLSRLQNEEEMVQDVIPEPVDKETINYFKSLMEILKISYCPSVTEKGEWNCDYCPSGMTLLLYFPVTTTGDFSGAIIRDDSKKTFYLLFSGTKSLQNVITDIQITLVPYDQIGHGAKLHKGIYNSYLTQQTLIQKTMLDEMSKNSDYQVIVMGHSLGAAITNVVVLDLYQRNLYLNEKNLRSVTAGGPPMWNRELAYYAASTDIKMVRLTHANDIVAGTSDVLKITGFVQSGIEYWNDKEDSLVCCNSNFETPNCINSRLLNPMKVVTVFSDHVMYLGQRVSQCSVDESKLVNSIKNF